MATASPIVILDQYEVNLHDKLGQGGFGSVYRGKDTRRGTKVAVKQMDLKKEAGADNIGSNALKEIKNLQKLPSHPHIVKFFDCDFKANSFWMVMEFCNSGNLKQYFDKYKPIDFETKVKFMQQATSAIAHLHGLPVPIIHRDLKPANIMLHNTGDRPVVKVTDFGLSKVAEDKEDMGTTFLMSTCAGTLAFMAPEFFMDEKYTSSVDVFALGLVYLGMLNYEVLGDILPLPVIKMKPRIKMATGQVMAYALISKSTPPPILEINSSDSKEMKEVKEVIQKMAKPKKEERINIKSVKARLDAIFDIDMSAPEIRKLPVALTMKYEKSNLRKVSIGQPDTYYPGTEKVLMLLGETGTGKSTLINGFVNYIMGVNYKDNFRYKLVDDKTERSQAHSQTKWITAYTFHKQPGLRLPYTFTIIDTPGYGDTEGLERDKEITKQIKDFFSIKGQQGIDHLNGIGFVVKASDCRLTITQRYIFDSILSMFGKDFSQNIFMMVTFSDGGNPPVLDAITEANFTFQDSFKFNNSALFAKIERKSRFDSLFWEMGVTSFEDFFTTFDNAKSVSLKLTKKVIKEREQLECVIQGLQKNIHAGLYKADQLHQEESIVREHEKDLLTNKDFIYEITVTKQRKVDLPYSTYVTNCLTCNRTCHYPCSISKREDMDGCAAMGSNGYCEVCPGKCYWDNHVNNPYRFELYQEKETRTSLELKYSYCELASKKTAAENVKTGLKKDLDNLYLNLLSMISQANSSIHRLQEIALRPNPSYELEYIDLLIESEKREGKPGFQQRIRALDDVRKQAKIISNIKEDQKITQMLKDATDYSWSKLKLW